MVQSDSSNLKILGKKDDAHQFYKKVKNYINFPSLCGKNDVDDVMIKYNFNCHDLNILPSTEILNFFVDNSLIIQNTFISFELSECIAKFISQNYQENEMFKIEKIFIDGCQIDDHKLYEILKSINGNKKQ